MATVQYPRARIERLIRRAETRFQTAFLNIVNSVLDEDTLQRIGDLLQRGRVQQAVEEAGRAMGARMANSQASVFTLAAEDHSEFFLDAMSVRIDFDITNDRAVRFLRNDRLRLIREITDSQAGAIRNALVEATERGLNPREQARAFRQAIGLTTRQERAVSRFRQLLEAGDSEALERQLRDRRLDPTVRRAIRGERALARGEVDRMVDRYRERYRKYRAKTIARTEALRAVHAGSDELMQQAIEQGKVDQAQIEQEWHTSLDGRERDSHRTMDGQTRPYGQPFTTGAGVSIRYPGDPAAPGSETIQCRCAVTMRVKNVDKPRKRPPQRRTQGQGAGQPPGRRGARPRARPPATPPLPASLTPSSRAWDAERPLNRFESAYMSTLAADAPEPFKRAAWRTRPVDRGRASSRATYDPSRHSIQMKAKPASIHDTIVFAHEFGHALDLQGAAVWSGRSMTLHTTQKADNGRIPDIKSVLDESVAVKERKLAALNRHWRKQDEDFDHAAALDDFLVSWPEAPREYLKGLPGLSAKAKLDFAADWESGNWEQAAKAMRLEIQRVRFAPGIDGNANAIRQLVEAGDMLTGHLSDAIEGMTNLRRMGHAHGLGGHGKRYRSAFGFQEGTSRAGLIEFFANAYLAHTAPGWQLWSYLLELALPVSTRAFREIIEEM